MTRHACPMCGTYTSGTTHYEVYLLKEGQDTPEAWHFCSKAHLVEYFDDYGKS